MNTSPVAVGDNFHDRRESNRRWLEVTAVDPAAGRAYYRVVRQEYNGVVTRPDRANDMTITRLTGRDFVRTTAEDANRP
ncbi:hypothetical protein [Nocardia carnea]|uniref:hypothetical protein n=1 Tax=Nocardia carnea TaxID=37328 RepID=UPI002453F304|nr:hypothetical protein [Nocardia carnea]